MMSDILVKDIVKKQIKVNGFMVEHNNAVSAEQTIEEIFGDLAYKFFSESESPFIIDAGSNIGIATLFFKEIYPNAKVLCFEPDAAAFELLKANMSNNKITNVDLINAATAKADGEIEIFWPNVCRYA